MNGSFEAQCIPLESICILTSPFVLADRSGENDFRRGAVQARGPAGESDRPLRDDLRQKRPRARAGRPRCVKGNIFIVAPFDLCIPVVNIV
jgi:hypothetical protein